MLFVHNISVQYTMEINKEVNLLSSREVNRPWNEFDLY